MLKKKIVFMGLILCLLTGFAFSADFDLEYRCGMTGSSSSLISGEVQITNNSGAAIDLSELTFQYYYTKEGSASEMGYCDFADVTGSNYRHVSGNVIISFESGYFEYGFNAAAGTLQAGDVLRVQFRVNKSDWSNYDQTNDASFDPSYGILAPYDGITINGATASSSLTISGYVTSMKTLGPISGALVSVEDQAVYTGADGSYTLTAEIEENKTAISIKADGFAAYHKPVTEVDGEAISYDAALLAYNKVETIDPYAPAGNTITCENGASVTIPGLTGISEFLVVALTSYDVSSQELEAAPGDFTAVNNAGDDVLLISQGMLDVNITGEDTGNYYSLDGMGSFEITIPVTGDPARAPSTIPLWYYDEEASVWVEEGTAVKNGDFYTGTVTHFSTHNADIAFENNLTVDGSIVDANYQSGDEYFIEVSAQGFSKTANSTQSDMTFSLARLPQDTNTTITVTNLRTGESVTRNFDTPASGTTHDAGVFQLQDLSRMTITGTIDDSNYTASKEYIISYRYWNMTETFIHSGSTDFSFYSYPDADIEIKVSDNTNGNYSIKTVTTPSTGTAVDAGIFTLASTDVQVEFTVNADHPYSGPHSSPYGDYVMIFTGDDLDCVLDASGTVSPDGIIRITMINFQVYPPNDIVLATVEEEFSMSSIDITNFDLKAFFNQYTTVPSTQMIPGVSYKPYILRIAAKNGDEWVEKELRIYLC